MNGGELFTFEVQYQSIMRFIAILWLVLFALPATAIAHASSITVQQGGSIQAAITTAHAGDTILVTGGKYYEHLRVTKAVNLIGQGMPVLDATASGSAITLMADGIRVQGFKIVNAGSWPAETKDDGAIKVLSNNNIISGNDISNNFCGILVLGGMNNSVRENILAGNLQYGIRFSGARNNTICNNRLEENRQNAFDDAEKGWNLWDMNYYSDFDVPGEGCSDDGTGICIASYGVPGGGSVDRRPRCLTMPDDAGRGAPAIRKT